jgi:hypothetical protein
MICSGQQIAQFLPHVFYYGELQEANEVMLFVHSPFSFSLLLCFTVCTFVTFVTWVYYLAPKIRDLAVTLLLLKCMHVLFMSRRERQRYVGSLSREDSARAGYGVNNFMSCLFEG